MLLKKPIIVALGYFCSLSLFGEAVNAAAIKMRSHTMRYSDAPRTLTKRELISCKGSAMCANKPVSGDFPSAIIYLQRYIKKIKNDKIYKNDALIACAEPGMCLSLQNTKAGIPGSDIKKLLAKLIDYGCEICGSIPTSAIRDDNEEDGELTVNYSREGMKCEGLCPESTFFGFPMKPCPYNPVHTKDCYIPERWQDEWLEWRGGGDGMPIKPEEDGD